MLTLQYQFRRCVKKYLHYHSYKLITTDIHEPDSPDYGFAPESIDIISHSQLDFINKQQRKKIDIMEEEISIYLESGFQVYEHDKVPIWNPSTLFQVGHRDQFNQFANDNIFKLFDTFMHPESSKQQWTISKPMKNELRLPHIKSVIDYYPFNNTFNDKKLITSTNKKKSELKKRNYKQNNWKRIPNEKYNNLTDCYGTNMPLLIRDDQELIIWRDNHDMITNMNKINKLLNEYKPDIIILEGNCDESIMKIYGKSSYNMYLNSVQKIFSRMVSSNYLNGEKQQRFGRFMYKLSDMLFVRQGEIQGGFTNHGIIKYMIDNCDNKQTIPLLVFGDLTLDINGVFMLIAKYFDTYQLPMLLQLLNELDNGLDNIVYKNIKNDVNFEEIYRKLLFDINGYDNLMDMLWQFLLPHQALVANYRNNFLCLAINEAAITQNYTFDNNKCKILSVMGLRHVNDVIYKLENMNENNVLVNPFKDITDKMVLLKSNIPMKSVNCFDIELNEKEQEFVIKEFGNNLLNVFQNKLQNIM